MFNNSLPSAMEVSNLHATSLKPQLNRPFLPQTGSISNIRDSNSFPCPCIKRSSMLHRLSSLSTNQQNLVLARSIGRGDGMGVLLNHNPNSRTAALGKLSLPCNSSAYHVRASPFRKASRSHSHRLCVAKSEGSGGALSSESITLDEETLKRDLQIAIQEENYARAAKLRDTLRFLQEDGKAAVLSANTRFYNSFRKGDLASMQALWAKGENVCVVHPGVGAISGYDLVMGSWELVWADYEFPLEIEVKDVQVHVRGDFGYVTCSEMVTTKGSSWGRQIATNVFEKIGGQWFICVHHASHVDF
ncbi:hypothetical protein RHGRI_015354 [Rhododendron griersonianum]|uniref:Uncharacterized protein n=1 Tax=Rhododendron griersonianum TaxID=479676 RepID=A0AAV6KD14_9ERIC|nr:hypothetical protein RHGRI_015354 [Rhododendron griersonianum]